MTLTDWLQVALGMVTGCAVASARSARRKLHSCEEALDTLADLLTEQVERESKLND